MLNENNKKCQTAALFASHGVAGSVTTCFISVVLEVVGYTSSMYTTPFKKTPGLPSFGEAVATIAIGSFISGFFVFGAAGQYHQSSYAILQREGANIKTVTQIILSDIQRADPGNPFVYLLYLATTFFSPVIGELCQNKAFNTTTAFFLVGTIYLAAFEVAAAMVIALLADALVNNIGSLCGRRFTMFNSTNHDALNQSLIRDEEQQDTTEASESNQNG